ncbi:nucleotidyltransferase family protein [Mycobacterium sp. ACS4331]|uniref:nucleotidyltransferase family protein n=1 Tax=Mycobacterium sp. ACS4331 TaxID=1834121 RepID=UPI0008008B7D|nr:nucleotidyltransferase family protein [Mycobacterium sp. ACS4331]OBF27925.1 molybdopterin-guanine dinucleotide biosynthesis protein MobA [Mycobacterium sp. ACS4331]
MSRVAGVLLAAGAGTRYGMPKVLAENGDWLQRAVRALARGGCDDVIVVLGAAEVDVPAPARAVTAADWADGMSASVRAGLRAADGADVAVLHVIDTPDVGADVVARVLRAGQGESGLARAVFGGRPGHPVVIAARHWPAVCGSLHGDHGARDFLRARGDVVEVGCDDIATGQDIDER